MQRESKTEVESPKKATFTLGDGHRNAGWIVRLSVAGVEIEAPDPPPLGAEIVVWAELIAGEGPLELRGRVQWSSAMRFSVQFGPLGVKETNAIVRVARRPAA
jgi:hypothetical protein